MLAGCTSGQPLPWGAVKLARHHANLKHARNACQRPCTEGQGAEDLGAEAPRLLLLFLADRRRAAHTSAASARTFMLCQVRSLPCPQEFMHTWPALSTSWLA